MGSEIQFGEIEESRPERQTPPDKSHQFAVVECQEPQSDELRIYVDLDVMKDMESHAESDTTVELGGVLLGRQLEDEQGQPFVVVSDSLRAQHYEATKGSF
ncbi:MAG: metal-dependent protease of the PAD1/JAB1 superfamily, partial [Planctomycetota bacterium]|nr:metal-dependent protease of the PAD1/JAB1 superfamily [Planctomycetota bacterium]